MLSRFEIVRTAIVVLVIVILSITAYVVLPEWAPKHRTLIAFYIFLFAFAMRLVWDYLSPRKA